MAEFLAQRVIDGYLTIDKIPQSLIDDVKEVLIEKGYDDLINA